MAVDITTAVAAYHDTARANSYHHIRMSCTYNGLTLYVTPILRLPHLQMRVCNICVNRSLASSPL